MSEGKPGESSARGLAVAPQLIGQMRLIGRMGRFGYALGRAIPTAAGAGLAGEPPVAHQLLRGPALVALSLTRGRGERTFFRSWGWVVDKSVGVRAWVGRVRLGPSDMEDQRRGEREPAVGVTTLAHRPDGGVLEGVVRDVSDGGIQVLGDPAGLQVGEHIDVVLVVNGQLVRYACEVRHVDETARIYGVFFRSGPTLVEPPTKVRRCMRCARNFPGECKFCSHCGQKLVTVTA